MRIRSVLVLGMATALALPLAAGASVGSTLVSSALPGTTRLLVAGATDLGPAPAALRQRVVLVLGLRNRGQLDRLIKAQATPGTADYQRWLSPQQFNAHFAPTTAAVSTATSWARGAGLAVVEVSTNRTLVTLEGSRAQLERALHVRLRAVRSGSSTYVTPDRSAVLPAAVSRLSVALLGLTTLNPFRTLHVTAAPSVVGTHAPPAGSFSPADFAATYHLPERAATGTGQSVAVITSGDISGVPGDLRTFQQRFGLRQVPMVTVQTTPEGGDDAGAVEYDLDTQVSTSFAPGVKSVIAYNAAQLGDVHPLNAVVTQKRVKTASASYGGCEPLLAARGDVTADEQVFLQADVQGQTFFVSSGDTGSACGPTPVGIAVPHTVSYPGSSKYVVSVGGTTLTTAIRQPEREITWTGGGGGQSVLESAPAWQRAAGTFQPRLGRGVPDVSLDADPESGYAIIVHGRQQVVGGTSASAPAWNGIWARVLQTHAKAGFAAPALYDRSGPALVDITLGSNGDYSAAPGYDLATGLGSVDVLTLINRIAI